MTSGDETTKAAAESVALEAAESSAPGSRTLLGAALLGSSATLIVGVLGVARTKVLAVELEPAGLGLYGQILTLLVAASSASGLGLGLGTTRVVAECRARGDVDGLKNALEVSFAAPLAVASVLAILIAGLSGLLAPLLLDDSRALLIVLAASAVPLVAVQGPLVHALQGFRDVAGAQAANVFFGVLLTVTSIVGAVTAGLDGAVFALAAGNLGYAAALAWRLRGLLRRAAVTLRLRAGLSRRRLREPLVRAMLGIGFASFFVGVAAGGADLLVRTLVLRGEGADEAGIFQALQLVSLQLVGVIVTAVVFLGFTATTEAHALEDRDGVRKVVDDTVRLALLLVLPALLVIGLLREDFVRILLSAEFGQASDLLPRQMAGDALRTIAWVLSAALIPVGMTRVWVGVTTLGLLTYVVAAAALVPAFGLDGAVDAYVIEWLVAAGLSAAVLVRSGYFVPSSLTVRTFACTVAVVGIIVSEPEPSRTVAVVAVGLCAIALLAICTAHEERVALAARVRGMLTRS